jgi:hypothetical protein
VSALSPPPVPLPPAPGTWTTPASARVPWLAARDLTARAYWLLVCALIAAYLAVWLVHFHYVYGVVMDDLSVYLKAQMAVANWRAAFTPQNVLHPFFLLVADPPLLSGQRLPSFPVPLLNESTGQFRFFLLYTVFLHAALLLTWAWLAPRLTQRRLIALLSLLLFSTSPTLIFWSPKPDSRLLGVPFILIGLALLLRLGRAASRPSEAATILAFLAGSLFGLAQAIHYTSFYLFVPLALVFWALWLWPRRRLASAWDAALCFAVGAVWLHALLEAISTFVIGLPLDKGVTATLFELRGVHTSPWSRQENLAIWGEIFASQMGLLLLAAIVVGWALYLRQALREYRVGRLAPLVVALGVPLALLYLAASGSMPFFRQTSVLQPFLFVFAAVAIVAAGERLRGRGALRLGVATVLLVLVGAVQWQQAAAVFQAHQALGRALEWTYARADSAAIVWLPLGTAEAGLNVADPAALAASPARYVISYFPYGLVLSRGDLRPCLEATAPLAVWPSFYATDTVWAEAKAFGHHDLRLDAMLRDVRVLDIADLRAALARCGP